jgi:iron complex outermembrane recepter protein
MNQHLAWIYKWTEMVGYASVVERIETGPTRPDPTRPDPTRPDPMKKPDCWPFLIAFTVAAPPAIAEEELFFAELPMVASVSRLPQRQADAPASVTVIDRDMIKASGARALNDVMRLVPGFQTFAHSDASARVNYHGITDDNDFSPRVQVLVDGRSLHSPLFRSGMNWGLVPVALEDIERIEVVRGSNTVSYGTNAFLGVINIITTDPALVRGTSVGINSGSQGVRDYTLRTGGKFGENGKFPADPAGTAR